MIFRPATNIFITFFKLFAPTACYLQFLIFYSSIVIWLTKLLVVLKINLNYSFRMWNRSKMGRRNGDRRTIIQKKNILYYHVLNAVCPVLSLSQ